MNDFKVCIKTVFDSNKIIQISVQYNKKILFVNTFFVSANYKKFSHERKINFHFQMWKYHCFVSAIDPYKILALFLGANFQKTL
jgi:hypothetical protein